MGVFLDFLDATSASSAPLGTTHGAAPKGAVLALFLCFFFQIQKTPNFVIS